jgi:hypothetical protein
VNKLFAYKSFSDGATFKDADVKQGIVTGYFSKFDNVDSDGDVIRKGAFAKTISENFSRIKHLMNHNVSQPLGKISFLKEDNYGLAYESQIGKHSLGVDFIKMVESGLITEHSIGFITIKRNQLQDFDGYMKNPTGGWYELTELMLMEGSSLTGWGANALTPLTGMKSEVDVDRIYEHQKAVEKFCKNTDATDETIEMLLLHSKQLSQYIIDLKAIQPEIPTEPDLVDAIKQFRKTINN